MTWEEGLQLDRGQLEDVRAALRDRIAEGLAHPDREIRALPTWLGFPPPDLAGEAVVVDLGGTNMRAAHVTLDGDGRSRLLAGPVAERVPDTRTHPMAAAPFFAAQTRLVGSLGVGAGVPVGYCFSYPTESLPSRDARLITWTKEMQVSGVEGTLVGAALASAMAAAGLEPRRVTVLNDTVASLLGVAYARPGAQHFIGLIVGTGSNMAGFFPAEAIDKLPPGAWQGRMAINLESGNFHPPHLTPLDDEMDATSDEPGRQRFEKAISGFYLPRLLARATGIEAPASSRTLVEMRDGRPDKPEGRASGLLLARSADLVAAGLAALVDHYPSDGSVCILAEGGFFWGDPHYPERVKRTLSTLLGSDRCAIERMEDVNLVGAACAALLP